MPTYTPEVLYRKILSDNSPNFLNLINQYKEISGLGSLGARLKIYDLLLQGKDPFDVENNVFDNDYVYETRAQELKDKIDNELKIGRVFKPIYKDTGEFELQLDKKQFLLKNLNNKEVMSTLSDIAKELGIDYTKEVKQAVANSLEQSVALEPFGKGIQISNEVERIRERILDEIDKSPNKNKYFDKIIDTIFKSVNKEVEERKQTGKLSKFINSTLTSFIETAYSVVPTAYYEFTTKYENYSDELLTLDLFSPNREKVEKYAKIYEELQKDREDNKWTYMTGELIGASLGLFVPGSVLSKGFGWGTSLAKAATYGELFRKYFVAEKLAKTPLLLNLIKTAGKSAIKYVPIYGSRLLEATVTGYITQTAAGLRDYLNLPEEDRDWFYDIFLNRQLEFISEALLVESNFAFNKTILRGMTPKKWATLYATNKIWNAAVNILTEEATNLAQDYYKDTETFLFKHGWNDAQTGALVLSGIFGSLGLVSDAINLSLNYKKGQKTLEEMLIGLAKYDRYHNLSKGITAINKVSKKNLKLGAFNVLKSVIEFGKSYDDSARQLALLDDKIREKFEIEEFDNAKGEAYETMKREEEQRLGRELTNLEDLLVRGLSTLKVVTSLTAPTDVELVDTFRKDFAIEEVANSIKSSIRKQFKEELRDESGTLKITGIKEIDDAFINEFLDKLITAETKEGKGFNIEKAKKDFIDNLTDEKIENILNAFLDLKELEKERGVEKKKLLIDNVKKAAIESIKDLSETYTLTEQDKDKLVAERKFDFDKHILDVNLTRLIQNKVIGDLPSLSEFNRKKIIAEGRKLLEKIIVENSGLKEEDEKLAAIKEKISAMNNFDLLYEFIDATKKETDIYLQQLSDKAKDLLQGTFLYSLKYLGVTDKVLSENAKEIKEDVKKAVKDIFDDKELEKLKQNLEKDKTEYYRYFVISVLSDYYEGFNNEELNGVKKEFQNFIKELEQDIDKIVEELKKKFDNKVFTKSEEYENAYYEAIDLIKAQLKEKELKGLSFFMPKNAFTRDLFTISVDVHRNIDEGYKEGLKLRTSKKTVEATTTVTKEKREEQSKKSSNKGKVKFTKITFNKDLENGFSTDILRILENYLKDKVEGNKYVSGNYLRLSNTALKNFIEVLLGISNKVVDLTNTELQLKNVNITKAKKLVFHILTKVLHDYIATNNPRSKSLLQTANGYLFLGVYRYFIDKKINIEFLKRLQEYNINELLVAFEQLKQQLDKDVLEITLPNGIQIKIDKAEILKLGSKILDENGNFKNVSIEKEDFNEVKSVLNKYKPEFGVSLIDNILIYLNDLLLIATIKGDHKLSKEIIETIDKFTNDFLGETFDLKSKEKIKNSVSAILNAFDNIYVNLGFEEDSYQYDQTIKIENEIEKIKAKNSEANGIRNILGNENKDNKYSYLNYRQTLEEAINKYASSSLSTSEFIDILTFESEYSGANSFLVRINDSLGISKIFTELLNQEGDNDITGNYIVNTSSGEKIISIYKIDPNSKEEKGFSLVEEELIALGEVLLEDDAKIRHENTDAIDDYNSLKPLEDIVEVKSLEIDQKEIESKVVAINNIVDKVRSQNTIYGAEDIKELINENVEELTKYIYILVNLISGDIKANRIDDNIEGYKYLLNLITEVYDPYKYVKAYLIAFEINKNLIDDFISENGELKGDVLGDNEKSKEIFELLGRIEAELSEATREIVANRQTSAPKIRVVVSDVEGTSSTVEYGYTQYLEHLLTDFGSILEYLANKNISKKDFVMFIKYYTIFRRYFLTSYRMFHFNLIDKLRTFEDKYNENLSRLNTAIRLRFSTSYKISTKFDPTSVGLEVTPRKTLHLAVSKYLYLDFIEYKKEVETILNGIKNKILNDIQTIKSEKGLLSILNDLSVLLELSKRLQDIANGIDFNVPNNEEEIKEEAIEIAELVLKVENEIRDAINQKLVESKENIERAKKEVKEETGKEIEKETEKVKEEVKKETEETTLEPKGEKIELLSGEFEGGEIAREEDIIEVLQTSEEKIENISGEDLLNKLLETEEINEITEKREGVLHFKTGLSKEKVMEALNKLYENNSEIKTIMSIIWLNNKDETVVYPKYEGEPLTALNIIGLILDLFEWKKVSETSDDILLAPEIEQIKKEQISEEVDTKTLIQNTLDSEEVKPLIELTKTLNIALVPTDEDRSAYYTKVIDGIRINYERIIKLYGTDNFKRQLTRILGHELAHAFLSRIIQKQGKDKFEENERALQEIYKQVIKFLYNIKQYSIAKKEEKGKYADEIKKLLNVKDDTVVLSIILRYSQKKVLENLEKVLHNDFSKEVPENITIEHLQEIFASGLTDTYEYLTALMFYLNPADLKKLNLDTNSEKVKKAINSPTLYRQFRLMYVKNIVNTINTFAKMIEGDENYKEMLKTGKANLLSQFNYLVSIINAELIDKELSNIDFRRKITLANRKKMFIYEDIVDENEILEEGEIPKEGSVVNGEVKELEFPDISSAPNDFSEGVNLSYYQIKELQKYVGDITDLENWINKFNEVGKTNPLREAIMTTYDEEHALYNSKKELLLARIITLFNLVNGRKAYRKYDIEIGGKKIGVIRRSQRFRNSKDSIVTNISDLIQLAMVITDLRQIIGIETLDIGLVNEFLYNGKEAKALHFENRMEDITVDLFYQGLIYINRFADRNTTPIFYFNDDTNTHVNLFRLTSKMINIYREYIKLLPANSNQILYTEEELNKLENAVNYIKEYGKELVRLYEWIKSEEFNTELQKLTTAIEEIANNEQIENKLEAEEQLVKSFIYEVMFKDFSEILVNSFADKIVLFTKDRISKLSDKIEKTYKEYVVSGKIPYRLYNNYVESLDPQIKRDIALVTAITLRTIIEDIKLGLKADEIGKNTKLKKGDKVRDFVTLMKRFVMASRYNYVGVNKYIFDKLGIEEVKNGGYRIVKNKNGEIEDVKIKVAIISSENLKNLFGQSLIDGVTIANDAVKKLIAKVQGIVSRSVYKNYIYNRNTGLYAKHAMFTLPEGDPIMKFMKENNIGLLISDEAEKNQVFDRSKFIKVDTIIENKQITLDTTEISIKDIHRIKEGATIDDEVKGYSQIMNTTQMILDNNSILSDEDKKLLSDFFTNLTKSAIKKFRSKVYGDNIYIEFLRHLGKIYYSPASQSTLFIKKLVTYISDIGIDGKKVNLPVILRNINNIDRLPSEELKRIVEIGSKLFNIFTELNFLMVVNDSLGYFLKSSLVDAVKVTSKGFSAVLTPDISPIRTKAIKTQLTITNKNFNAIINSKKEIDVANKEKYNLLEQKVSMLKLKDKLLRELIIKHDTEKVTDEFTKIYHNTDREVGKLLLEINELLEELKIFEEESIKQELSYALFNSNDYVNQRLTLGSIVISYFDAANNNLKLRDRIVSYVVPSDSPLSTSGNVIVGILPESLLEVNTVIMNSEYIQGLAGKDYDIDVIYFIRKPDDMNFDTWKKINQTLKNNVTNYVYKLFDLMYGDLKNFVDSFDEKNIELNESEKYILFNKEKKLLEKTPIEKIPKTRKRLFELIADYKYKMINEEKREKNKELYDFIDVLLTNEEFLNNLSYNFELETVLLYTGLNKTLNASNVREYVQNLADSIDRLIEIANQNKDEKLLAQLDLCFSNDEINFKHLPEFLRTLLGQDKKISQLYEVITEQKITDEILLKTILNIKINFITKFISSLDFKNNEAKSLYLTAIKKRKEKINEVIETLYRNKNIQQEEEINKDQLIYSLFYELDNLVNKYFDDANLGVGILKDSGITDYKAGIGKVNVSNKLEATKIATELARKLYIDNTINVEKDKIKEVKKNMYKELKSKLESYKDLQEKDFIKKAEFISDLRLRLRWMQLYLGVNASYREENVPYHPLEKETVRVGEMFQKQIGQVIILRELFSIASVINKNDENFKNTEWMRKHLALLILTNDMVDFPKNSNKAYYNSDIPFVYGKILEPNYYSLPIEKLAEKLAYQLDNILSQAFNIPRLSFKDKTSSVYLETTPMYLTLKAIGDVNSALEDMKNNKQENLVNDLLREIPLYNIPNELGVKDENNLTVVERTLTMIRNLFYDSVDISRYIRSVNFDYQNAVNTFETYFGVDLNDFIEKGLEISEKYIELMIRKDNGETIEETEEKAIIEQYKQLFTNLIKAIYEHIKRQQLEGIEVRLDEKELDKILDKMLSSTFTPVVSIATGGVATTDNPFAFTAYYYNIAKYDAKPNESGIIPKSERGIIGIKEDTGIANAVRRLLIKNDTMIKLFQILSYNATRIEGSVEVTNPLTAIKIKFLDEDRPYNSLGEVIHDIRGSIHLIFRLDDLGTIPRKDSYRFLFAYLFERFIDILGNTDKQVFLEKFKAKARDHKLSIASSLGSIESKLQNIQFEFTYDNNKMKGMLIASLDKRKLMFIETEEKNMNILKEKFELEDFFTQDIDEISKVAEELQIGNIYYTDFENYSDSELFKKLLNTPEIIDSFSFRKQLVSHTIGDKEFLPELEKAYILSGVLENIIKTEFDYYTLGMAVNLSYGIPSNLLPMVIYSGKIPGLIIRTNRINNMPRIGNPIYSSGSVDMYRSMLLALMTSNLEDWKKYDIQSPMELVIETTYLLTSNNLEGLEKEVSREKSKKSGDEIIDEFDGMFYFPDLANEEINTLQEGLAKNVPSYKDFRKLILSDNIENIEKSKSMLKTISVLNVMKNRYSANEVSKIVRKFNYKETVTEVEEFINNADDISKKLIEDSFSVIDQIYNQLYTLINPEPEDLGKVLIANNEYVVKRKKYSIVSMYYTYYHNLVKGIPGDISSVGKLWLSMFYNLQLSGRLLANKLFTTNSTLPRDLSYTFSVEQNKEGIYLTAKDIAIGYSYIGGDEQVAKDGISLTDIYYEKISELNRSLTIYKQKTITILNKVFDDTGLSTSEFSDYLLKLEELYDLLLTFPFLTVAIVDNKPVLTLQRYNDKTLKNEIVYLTSLVGKSSLDLHEQLEKYIVLLKLYLENYLGNEVIGDESISKLLVDKRKTGEISEEDIKYFSKRILQMFDKMKLTKNRAKDLLVKIERLEKLKEETKGKKTFPELVANVIDLKMLIVEYTNLARLTAKFFEQNVQIEEELFGEDTPLKTYAFGMFYKYRTLRDRLYYGGNSIEWFNDLGLGKCAFKPKIFTVDYYIELVSENKAKYLANKKGIDKEEAKKMIKEKLKDELEGRHWVSSFLHASYLGNDLLEVRDLRAAFETLMIDLTETIEKDVLRYYSEQYKKYGSMYENRKAYQHMANVFDSLRVRHRLRADIKSVMDLKKDEYVSFYINVEAEDKATGMPYTYKKFIIGSVSEITDEYIAIEDNNGKITKYSLDDVHIISEGKETYGYVETITDKRSWLFRKKFKWLSKLEFLTHSYVASLIRGGINKFKSMFTQWFGTPMKLVETSPKFLYQYFTLRDVERKIKYNELTAKELGIFAENLVKLSQISQNVIIDMFYGKYSEQVDPDRKILNYIETDDKFYQKGRLWKALKLFTYRDRLTALHNRLMDTERLIRKYSQSNNRAKAELLKSLRNQIITDINKLEVEELHSKVSKFDDPEVAELIEELYGAVKELANLGNIQFIGNITGEHANVILKKYLKDVFINDRLKSINSVEGKIREASYMIRFLHYYDRSKKMVWLHEDRDSIIEDAIKYAIRGVTIDHALYDIINRNPSATTRLGRVIEHLRQYNYNRIVGTLMMFKEFRDAIKIFGLGKLLSEYIRDILHKPTILKENPIKHIVNFIKSQYLIFVLSYFVPALRWYMNPLGLVFFQTIESLIYLADPDEEEDPIQKRFYIISLVNLFTGFGGSMLATTVLGLLDAFNEGDEKTAAERMADYFINTGFIRVLGDIDMAYNRITDPRKRSNFGEIINLGVKIATGLAAFETLKDLKTDYTIQESLWNAMTLGYRRLESTKLERDLERQLNTQMWKLDNIEKILEENMNRLLKQYQL